MKRLTLEERANRVRYCSRCDYVVLADSHILKQLHIQSCREYLNGWDCMHLEGKTHCECDAA